jgi:hypothetical protein
MGGSNSAAPENVKVNSTLAIAERSWLAVTSVDDPSKFQYDDYGRPRGSFIAYNSEAPRTNVTSGLLSKIPGLKNAFGGADGCRNGTEICEVSHGFSEGGDRESYELSVSRDEARAIKEEIPLSPKTNDALLAFGDKLYWLVLHTTSDFRAPQMATELVEKVPIEPTQLERGQTLEYTILIKTWATFGGPVEMNLYGAPSSADSGISVKVEPDHVVLNERAEQKVRLIITPTDKAKEGVYPIRMWGKFANTDFFWPDNPCQHSACPSVKVGKSLWRVGNYAGYSGIGGNKPPEWLKLRLTTDKKTYHPGETVRFTAYLDNQSADSKLVIDELRLLINIYSSGKSPADNIFNIDAWYMADGNLADDIVLEPGSTIILAYPFEWNQKILKNGILSEDNVDGGSYAIDADLAISPGGYAIYDSQKIVIGEQ